MRVILKARYEKSWLSFELNPETIKAMIKSNSDNYITGYPFDRLVNNPKCNMTEVILTNR